MSHGWAGAARSPLAGDASLRRYERVVQDSRRAVLMDAPPGREALGPFIRIDRYLRARGYSAPEIYAADEAAGLMLLEDLGDGRYFPAYLIRPWSIRTRKSYCSRSLKSLTLS